VGGRPVRTTTDAEPAVASTRSAGLLPPDLLPLGLLPLGLLLLGLLLLTGLRLLVAATTPLAPDEAYYWIWSRALAPGYLDHPPMVALWIRIGTDIAGPGTLGVRLLAPLSALLGSLLLADAAACLLPNRHAGVTAAALLNATLLFGVGSVIMTPDTPLLFFWTASLWATARLLRGGRAGWWIAAGLFAGLALDSDYTALLLPAGIGLWLLLPEQRRWLRHPAPWIGLLAAFLVFLPVLVWNAQHGWAGMLRQGGRVADWQPARAAQFLGELLGAQFGLATPLVFVLCVAGALEAVRHLVRRREPGWSLLALLILPGTLVFVQHAIGDRVQGNWPAILYPAAAVAAAGLLRPFYRWLVSPAVMLGLAITALVYAQAALAFVPLPARLDPVTRQLRGWNRLAAEVAAVAGRRDAGFVAAQQYAVASELAYALPGTLPVVGVDPRWAFLALPPARTGTAAGLLVWPASGAGPDPAVWPGVHLVGGAGRGTLDAPIEVFRLYEVSGLPASVPNAELPGW